MNQGKPTTSAIEMGLSEVWRESISGLEAALATALVEQEKNIRRLRGWIVGLSAICALMVLLSISLLNSRQKLRNELKAVTGEIRAQVEANQQRLEDIYKSLPGPG